MYTLMFSSVLAPTEIHNPYNSCLFTGIKKIDVPMMAEVVSRRLVAFF